MICIFVYGGFTLRPADKHGDGDQYHLGEYQQNEERDHPFPPSVELNAGKCAEHRREGRRESYYAESGMPQLWQKRYFPRASPPAPQWLVMDSSSI
ncbi:hypothetical protein SDC9_180464 [bioreactor metagenome]|uniref:Uncharacterized protein n=1 Tax=bioreactor metagenome TaxID=1076179 RepID=A0A645H1T5_9ZZZZ